LFFLLSLSQERKKKNNKDMSDFIKRYQQMDSTNNFRRLNDERNLLALTKKFTGDPLFPEIAKEVTSIAKSLSF
jgi:hypothetical protein